MRDGAVAAMIVAMKVKVVAVREQGSGRESGGISGCSEGGDSENTGGGDGGNGPDGGDSNGCDDVDD